LAFEGSKVHINPADLEIIRACRSKGFTSIVRGRKTQKTEIKVGGKKIFKRVFKIRKTRIKIEGKKLSRG